MRAKKFWWMIGSIGLYALLVNSRGEFLNPLFSGVPVPLQLVVPVLAGIFLGWKAGFFVGVLGSVVAGFTPAGSYFELVRAIPHGFAGLVAGRVRLRGAITPSIVLAIFVSQIAYLAAFIGAGLLSFDSVMNQTLWEILFSEVVLISLFAIIIYRILLLVQAPTTTPKRKLRQISLHVGVWKILFVIALCVTALFILFFSFPMISLALVLGGCFLVLSEKLRSDYVSYANNRGLTGWRRSLFGRVVAVFWIVVVCAVSFSAINSVSDAISDLGTREASDYIEFLEPLVPPFILEYVFTERVINVVEEATFTILANVLSNATSFFFIAIILIPLMFITYYRQGSEISQGFTQIIPESIRSDITRMIETIALQLRTFLTAKIVESLVIALLCMIGFFVAGIPGFVLLGLLAGLLNIIPYAGPLLGAIPPFLIATAYDPMSVVIVLVTVIVAQIIDNAYLQPFMIASQVEINPLLSVLLILFGAQMLGILGMLFAIPVYLVYKLVLSESHRILVSYTREE